MTHRLLAFAFLLSIAAPAWASSTVQKHDADTQGAGVSRNDGLSDKEAAALATIFCVVFAGIAVVGVAIQVLILVFVYKDATNRGDRNSAIWLLIVFFLGLIGLVIYLIARPAGHVIPCHACRRKRLDVLAACPHCGAPGA